MSKFIKISLSFLLGLPLLLLLAIVVFIQFQDANRYKAYIEEQAKQQVGLNLSIDGKLDWSLFPLGIDINQVSVDDQAGQAFASVNQVIAQIDLFSLFSGSPSIHTLLLDGAALNLVEKAEGNANWLNILPETDTTNSSAKIKGKPEKTGNENKELSFLLSKLEVSNLSLHFLSEPKGQNIKLAPVNIVISDIAPNNDIPLEISFVFEDVIQKLFLKTNILAELNFSPDFTNINITKLHSTLEVNGDLTKSETIEAGIDSRLSLNTKTQEISISELSLALENLKLESQINIKNYSEAIEVKGDFHLTPFSPKLIASKFKTPLPELASQNSLEKLSLKSAFSLSNDTFQLSQLNVNLDESRWQGNVSLNTVSQALKLKLEGDELNLDNYLPKAVENKTTNNAGQTETKTNKTPTDLLPLELIRQLDLDISLKQKSLRAKKVLIENINLQTTAKNGVITLKNLSAQSHEGSFTTAATLDARSDEPIWKAESNISNLNLGSLIQTLELQKADDLATLNGALNFKTTLATRGNQITKLLNNALADAQFDIAKGEINGVNLKALSCEGLALINKESISTRNWPKATPFETLEGKAKLNNNILNSRFDLVSAGLTADAEGPVNLNNSFLDFRVALKVTGDSNERSCRVNEKFKDIPIPVRCKGKLDTPPAELCSLDEKRLLDASKKVLVKEGKRKLQKEIDRALNKKLSDKGELKDAAKNLLKKLF